MFCKTYWAVVLACLALATPVSLRAESVAGTIRTLTGNAVVERGVDKLEVFTGMPIYPQDVLQTLGQSSVGIILHDDTLISMGPDSTLHLKEYVFEPKESSFSAVFGFLKGTFAYLSGAIGKLNPEAIRLETPTSTIAVRGTRLLVKVN